MYNFISNEEIKDTVKDIFLPDNNRSNGTILFNKKYGDIKLNYYCTGNGITYTLFMAKFNNDTIMEGSNNHDMTFISFNTANSIIMKNMKNNETFSFDKNRCWQGKYSRNHRSNGIYSKNKKYMSHHITLNNDLFETITAHKKELYKENILVDTNCISLNCNNIISNKQKTIINEIQHSGFSNSLQKLYMESKILDLIYTTINQSIIKEKNSNMYISDADIISLNKAKEIVLNDISNPPSLKELARKVAINEFKLKKGFKHLFGNTVYGLVQKQRLNKSKELLEKDDINVSEAAFYVGYKSTGHFSKIFKEKFGVLASDVMKSRKYY